MALATACATLSAAELASFSHGQLLHCAKASETALLITPFVYDDADETASDVQSLSILLALPSTSFGTDRQKSTNRNEKTLFVAIILKNGLIRLMSLRSLAMSYR